MTVSRIIYKPAQGRLKIITEFTHKSHSIARSPVSITDFSPKGGRYLQQVHIKRLVVKDCDMNDS